MPRPTQFPEENPTADLERRLAILERSLQRASSEVSPGTITGYGGTTAPTGWLLCDGASHTTASQPELFAAIGYVYGGSGANFNVPDLRGRFPLGKATSGTGSTLGGTGGVIDHVHTGPSHQHTGPSHTHTQGSSGAAGGHTHTTGGAHGGHGAAGGHTHTSGGAHTGHGTPTSTITVDANLDGATAIVGSSGHTHNDSAGGHTHNTIANHSHTTSAGAHTHDTIADHSHTNPATDADGTGLTGAAGTGNTGTANPPFQSVNYIIRT